MQISVLPLFVVTIVSGRMRLQTCIFDRVLHCAPEVKMAHEEARAPRCCWQTDGQCALKGLALTLSESSVASQAT